MNKAVTIVFGNNSKRLLIITTNKHIVDPKFTIGDLVLVTRAIDRGHKLNFKWTALTPIKDAHGQQFYTVTNIVSYKSHRVNFTRLSQYRAGRDGSDVTGERVKFSNSTIARYDTIEVLLDIY